MCWRSLVHGKEFSSFVAVKFIFLGEKALEIGSLHRNLCHGGDC